MLRSTAELLCGSAMIVHARPPLSRAVWVVGAGIALLLLSTAGRYGIFRDEYYYLMCADHPAWGYVDHPPLAMFLLALWKAVFGSSVTALRIPPSLLGGMVAVGAALVAREMRGGAVAQSMAALTAGLMPGTLALGSFYSMNSFDVVLWVLVVWIACRLLDPAGDRRWWWGLGGAVGLGLLNKYSMGFLCVGLGLGILMSPLRRELFTRQRLAGTLVVLLIVSPHVLWQIRQGWPTPEFIHNAQGVKNVALDPAEFWGEQLLLAHPGFLPVWVIGLSCLLFMPRLRPWRPLGMAFVVIGLWHTVSRAKPYYLVPAYPMLMAAGSAVITGWLSLRGRALRVIMVSLPVLLAVQGILIAPMAIPVLRPDAYVAYEQALGLRPKNMEQNAVGVLPQHFADRFGWEELAVTVRKVVSALPEATRSQTLVVAGNYGECGAINYWGLPPGVPPSVSGHNSCFSWWPADFRPEIVVVIGIPREKVGEVFEIVQLGAVHDSQWAMPYEQEVPIWVCRGWKVEPAVVRKSLRFAI
ncbi:glycosyltransferase family 39 protein [Candidatus Fermentibacteria bacterium]|nr:glycosyltransferase family 39 protein [Candidatus Fermentibacteria bacterium]